MDRQQGTTCLQTLLHYVVEKCKAGQTACLVSAGKKEHPTFKKPWLPNTQSGLSGKQIILMPPVARAGIGFVHKSAEPLGKKRDSCQWRDLNVVRAPCLARKKTTRFQKNGLSFAHPARRGGNDPHETAPEAQDPCFLAEPCFLERLWHTE